MNSKKEQDRNRNTLFPYFFCFMILASGAISLTVQASTLRVPDQYDTVSAAASAAENGDTIEIESGTYTGQGIVATWPKNNLVIRGVNGRAHMNADGVTISNGKSIWLTTGDHITIQNIEFSNAHVPENNGSGIRHEGGLLTVSNCLFHDNENGLRGSKVAEEIIVEYCEFNHNGFNENGLNHNIYIGNIDSFTIRYSYSHHAFYGHNLKTRANTNFILYNRIMDESTGNAAYQIDVPDGGLTYIIGNTIHQGAIPENDSMISYAVESQKNPVQKLYVSGNTLVSDKSPAKGIRIKGTPVAEIVNNIFDNLTTPVNGSASRYQNNIDGDMDNYFVDRGAYDFHLTVDSPAIGGAVNPGNAGGFNLTPVYEYVHPCSKKDRPNDGHLDIGAFEYVTAEILPGDINGDGSRNLADAITALLLASSLETDENIDTTGDVDENMKIGLEEAIFILQHLANLR